MGRYICQKGKDINIAKANKVCLIKRCPELWMKKKVMAKGKLTTITFPVISEALNETGC